MFTMPRAELEERPRQASWPTQLLDLFLIELTNWRWSWRDIGSTSAELFQPASQPRCRSVRTFPAEARFTMPI